MKYLLQFTRILAVTLVSELIRALVPLPVPASIYGIVILFLLLETGIMPLESVKETGKFLVEIMPVMFIPAAVRVLESFDVIAPSLAAYIAVAVISTVAVMGISGAVTQAVIRAGRRKK